MKKKVQNKSFYFLMILLLASGCVNEPINPWTATPPVSIQTNTPTVSSTTLTSTPTPTRVKTATPLPSPTPTPRIHVIAKGETLGGIAWSNNVSLDELITLNPEINPSFLIVGTELIIPASTLVPQEKTPNPTPVVIPVHDLTCSRSEEGGVWCFVMAENTNDYAVENVVTVIRLADPQAQQVLSQTAYAPLTVLAKGEQIPLAAYFPPPVPDPFVVDAESAKVVPSTSSDTRFIPLEIEDLDIKIIEDGRAAQIEGQLMMPNQGEPAQKIWLAAVGFDENDQIVGMRRWESSSPLEHGQTLGFQMTVYSSASAIRNVHLYAQATP